MKTSLRRQGACHECKRTPRRLGDARQGNASFPKSCDKAKCLGAGAETKEVAVPGFLCLVHGLRPPLPDGAEWLRGLWGAAVDEVKRIFPVDGPIPG